MKISNQSRVQSPESRVHRRRTGDCGLRTGDCESGFTMVEIAICLAIIGIALISIIGVLPIGMNTQRDNREETIINQDATVLLEAVRGGARGMDDLTNYVYAITNYWGSYKPDGTLNQTNANGYTFAGFSIGPSYYSSSGSPITNGYQIVGLLSTPEFTDLNGNPTNTFFGGGYSNHIVAYVHSISGPAIEKPLQDNDIVREDSFGYRLLCINSPMTAHTADLTTITNDIGVVTNEYFKQLSANLHELRMTFFWPQQPNGSLGPGRQSFRTLIAGRVVQTNDNGQHLYFYQSQSFVNVANTP
jgi:prepilin-type N-terminal cleavage/methylation domain-containing protein